MEVSEAQVKLIDALIRGEIRPEKANKRTLKALEDKGLYADGLVTQEGLKYTNVGVVEVDVVKFGNEVVYNQPMPNGKYHTLRFPQGTEMIVTFVIQDKKMDYLEGMVSVNGKPLWVRIANRSSFSFVKRLMPVKEKP